MQRKVIVIDDEKNTLEKALEEAKVHEKNGHQVAFDLTKIKDRNRKTEIIMKTKSL